MEKSVIGRCVACGEMTTLEYPCCGAPLEFEGGLIKPVDEPNTSESEENKLGFPRRSGHEE